MASPSERLVGALMGIPMMSAFGLIMGYTLTLYALGISCLTGRLFSTEAACVADPKPVAAAAGYVGLVIGLVAALTIFIGSAIIRHRRREKYDGYGGAP